MGRLATNGDGARDVRMVRRLRHVIESDGRIPRLDVDVDVGNGVIELLGVIPNEREHNALLTLVESAAGSRRVVDHLIVQGSDR
jgi:osmotically-inducible protein OsmY